MKKPSAMIDAGHGGEDPGAVGPGGLQEKAVALSVAMLTGALLVEAGVDVYYTRKTDVFVALPERARLANDRGVDVLLSIHCNSAKIPASGFEVFTTPGDTGADPFATELFKAFGAEFPTMPRRVDTKDGDPDKEADFAVLRKSRMPAALFELEFIHTAQGEDFLSNPQNQLRCARALAAGTLAHLRISGADPIKPTPIKARMLAMAAELKALAAQA
jgi:N-acetylmuramoyl-L-alanine amidase